MLSSREKQILLKLRYQDLSGQELSKQLNISRRTIIREIKLINRQLIREKIGRITIQKNYHLEVKTESISLLLNLISQSNPDEYRVLLFLLLSEVVSMDDLSEATFLSKAVIKDCLKKLSDAYQNVFSIEIKKGKGIYLRILRLSNEDILASLLLEFPHLIECLQEYIATKINGQNFCQIKKKLDLDKKISLRKKLQIISVLAISILQGNRNLDRQVDAFFAQKNDLLKKLEKQKSKIFELITSLMKHYSFYTNQSIVCMIFEHISRSVLFPDVVQTVSKFDFQKIYLQNPFVFDFSQDLLEKLQNEFPEIFINQGYLALYALMAVKEMSYDEVHHLLLLSDQYSLASLNKMIIEKSIPDVECTVEQNIFKRTDYNESFDLVLVNNEMKIDTGLKVDYFFPGLLGQDQVKLIKSKLERKLIGKKIFDQLNQKEHILNLQVQNNDNFFKILNVGFDKLIFQKLLLPEEKNKLLTRERQGNQLVIKNISIPHIITPFITTDFRIFLFRLNNYVLVDNKKVNQIMIILVSDLAKTKSNIFKYVYQYIINADTEQEDFDFLKLFEER